MEISAHTKEMMAIGKQLVDLCNEGKHLEVIDTLYADSIVSIEAIEMPGHPKRQEGIEAIRKKSQMFFQMNEIHGGEIKGPYPFDEGFYIWMSIDVTAKEGPFAGQRMLMHEVCKYTVKDGKIVEEEFFYAPE